MARSPETSSLNSRHVLMAGFGGLLLLMAFAGLESVRSLQQVQTGNDSIREDFLLRTPLLERICGDVYVSGTYVKHYLVKAESGRAEGRRRRDVSFLRDEVFRRRVAVESAPGHGTLLRVMLPLAGEVAA